MNKSIKEQLEDLWCYDENIETPLEVERISLPVSDDFMPNDVKQLEMAWDELCGPGYFKSCHEDVKQLDNSYVSETKIDFSDDDKAWLTEMGNTIFSEPILKPTESTCTASNDVNPTQDRLNLDEGLK